MGEQFLRVIAGLFVGVWVARYLGPEQYGLLSYVLAFIAIFGGVAVHVDCGRFPSPSSLGESRGLDQRGFVADHLNQHGYGKFWSLHPAF